MTDRPWQVRRIFRPVAWRAVGWVSAGLVMLFWLFLTLFKLWVFPALVLFPIIGSVWLRDLPWTTVLIYDEGLEIRPSSLSWKAYAWDEVRGLLILPDGLSLDLGERRVVIDRGLRDWEELRDIILRNCPAKIQEPHPERQPLDPARVESWLGVEPHGQVVCHRGVLTRGAWLGLAVLGIGTAVLRHYDLLAHAGGMWVCWVSLASEFVRNRRWRWSVTANRYGLSLRRGRRKLEVGWHQLLSVEAAPQSTKDRRLVRTTVGEFELSERQPQAEQLLAAIEQAIEANQAGAQFSAAPDVPASAISLTRLTGDPAAERGVSVVREDSGDGS